MRRTLAVGVRPALVAVCAGLTCALSTGVAYADNTVHWGSLGGGTTAGWWRAADGIKADTYIYARAAVQDGERVNSLYLQDTVNGNSVEYGWGWLCPIGGPYTTNTQSLTLFVVKTYPVYTEVRLTDSISPGTRPRIHLRLNPDSQEPSRDDFEYFLDNVRIATWANTGVYPPANGFYGAERYSPDDNNTASWTYCGYSDLVGGTHQWHYLTSAATGSVVGLQDPVFFFWANKIGQSNHCLYVDDAEQ